MSQSNWSVFRVGQTVKLKPNLHAILGDMYFHMNSLVGQIKRVDKPDEDGMPVYSVKSCNEYFTVTGEMIRGEPQAEH